MKKISLSLIAAALLFCGCNNSKQFEVSLNLSKMDGQTVYLCKSVDGADVLVDSTVMVDNKAVMTVDNDDPQRLYVVKFDKDASCGVFTFFTENQNTTISGEGDDMPRWTVEGCPSMKVLMDHHQKCMELYENKIMATYQEMFMAVDDSVKVMQLNEGLQPLIAEYFNYQADFIRQHADSYIGHYMLDEIKESIDFEQVKELAACLKGETEFSKQVQKYIEEGPQQQPACCAVE